MANVQKVLHVLLQKTAVLAELMLENVLWRGEADKIHSGGRVFCNRTSKKPLTTVSTKQNTLMINGKAEHSLDYNIRVTFKTRQGIQEHSKYIWKVRVKTAEVILDETQVRERG